jgi:putative transposase
VVLKWPRLWDRRLEMRIAALGPKPRTTKPALGARSSGSFCATGDRAAEAGVTHIPIGRGFLYLVAVIDRASRAVLAWRLSNTMDTAFCADTLDEVQARSWT